MNTYSENLLEAKAILGSFAAVGKLCGVSGRAVMKWVAVGKPPRTEYTGETNYAEIISLAVQEKISQADLLPDIRLLNVKQSPDNLLHDRRKTDRRAQITD